MPLSLRPLESRQQLDDFLARPELSDFGRFQQTWEWGDFQISCGNRVDRVGVWDGDELVATALLVHTSDHIAPLLHCPRGPATDYRNRERAAEVLRAVIDFGRGKGATYLRVDPALVRGTPEAALLHTSGLRTAARLVQVERAWMIDLGGRSDGDLLAWMRDHGMRSNIPRYLRRAERLGITVRASTEQRDLDTFVEMTVALDTRKGGILMLPAEYYGRQLGALGPSGKEHVFIAERDGEPLCAALIAAHGDEGSYLHGASFDTHKELHAPHYMHWCIMRWLRDRGHARYNMWGVVGEKHHKPGHRGYGFSEFKRSFGGYIEHYVRAADRPYNPARYAAVWMKDLIRGRQLEMD